MGAAPTLHEFPQVPCLDRLADATDLRKGDGEVVLGDRPLVPREFGGGPLRAGRALADPVFELRGAPGAIDEHHPARPRVLRVRSRVKEVASEETRKGEEHGVARPEEMHRKVGAEALPRRNDDLHKVPEAVRLHEWNDAADGRDIDS